MHRSISLAILTVCCCNSAQLKGQPDYLVDRRSRSPTGMGIGKLPIICVHFIFRASRVLAKYHDSLHSVYPSIIHLAASLPGPHVSPCRLAVWPSQPTAVTLVGATGLTGSSTLTALLGSTDPFAIRTIARKVIPVQTARNNATTFTHTLVEDMFSAPQSAVGEQGGVYISCLGTTRAAAGGVEKQEKIDLVLNRDLAKRAKEDGVDTVSELPLSLNLEGTFALVRRKH